ncbi:MAG TPA: PAS domain-containing protein, partial [Trueperaceae bacterium]
MTVERTTSSRPWAHLVGDMRAYAVFTLDAGGVIDSRNAGVRELLGYEEHEFLGKSGSIIFTLEDRMAGVDQRELDTAREHGEAMDDRWHVRKN